MDQEQVLLALMGRVRENWHKLSDTGRYLMLQCIRSLEADVGIKDRGFKLEGWLSQ